jgi:hypothetical protein
MRYYSLGILLALYFILLVHFVVQARGKKNLKSIQESSWDKVASGVKVTSWLYITK